MVVEFSEFVHWPGLLRFDSLADLFMQLASIANGSDVRAAVVRKMRRFNTHARTTGKAWWSGVMHKLLTDPGDVELPQVQ
jgi:hypothetical protein